MNLNLETLTDEPIELTESLFLGRGAHKATYAHPMDERLCIKIPFRMPDEDIKKELRYRAVLGQKADGMKLLAKYYGTVETNMGQGFLFEKVVNFDGTGCMSLAQYIQGGPSPEGLLSLLLDFREEFFRGRYVVAGTNIDNFLVQRISKNKCCIKIVDDLGTGAFIPILYYFDKLLFRRAVKYWRSLVHQLRADYGGIVTDEMASSLLEGLPPMHICLLSEKVGPAVQIGDFLAKTGNHVTMMTLEDSLSENRVNLLRLHKRLSWFEILLRLTTTHWRTDALLLDRVPLIALPSVLFAILFDKPVTILASEEDFRLFSNKGVVSWLLRKCRCFVVNDESVKHRVSNQYGIKAKEIFALEGQVPNRLTPRSMLQLQFLLHGDF